jgi:Zn-dependent protease
MDQALLTRGLMMFVGFVALVSLHEFAHAWMATRCGDDTPRLQGRLTLDPLAHIDLLGTIILPLIVIVVGAAGGQMMLFGWGKPVEVNPDNFGRRRLDDILVSGAGPAMNVITAVGILGLTRLIDWSGGDSFMGPGLSLARLSLFLCFFNLLPVPPLDGGHILRNLVGMSDDAYRFLSQFSFLFFIVIIQVPAVQRLLAIVTELTLILLAWPMGLLG